MSTATNFADYLPAPSILAARYGLTGREVEVAILLAHGARNRTIAERLRISPHTARHHTEAVLMKLGLTARGEVCLILIAATRGPFG
jgi:DNA-binding CsgD family transcriptional regulator